MDAVFPEYAMPPNNTGAANLGKIVCATDAALSRPVELVRATTTKFNASVNGTVIVAVIPVTDVVTPVTTELSDALRTCSEVTPDVTVYVMVAV